jgi:energy-coupling factor transport system ATP-binding protein
MEPVSEVIRKNGMVTAIVGPNFSGRSKWLRARTADAQHRPQVDATEVQPSVYIGPEVYNALSGLSQTVEEELRLHSGQALNVSPIAHLVEALGLFELRRQSPFSLSGGEQAALVALAAASLSPSILALDCALEQIDRERKQMLLLGLCGLDSGMSVLLADNRLTELQHACERVVFPPRDTLRESNRFGPVKAEWPDLDNGSPCHLKLDDLWFGYNRHKPVLRGIDADLTPGRIYLLEGGNGAGKSTLAKILSGVLRPGQGLILQDHAVAQPWRSPGRLVAYHFQNPDLQLFSTSVADELIAAPRAAGLEKNAAIQRSRTLMDVFGLSELSEDHPLDLPFVVRKRVALAATLSMIAPWYILDEPTLGQDDSVATALVGIITGLAQSGAGVIVISHSPSFRNQLAAVRLLLAAGKLSL